MFPHPYKKTNSYHVYNIFSFPLPAFMRNLCPSQRFFYSQDLHESFFLSFTGNKTTAYAGAAVNDSLKLHAIIRFAATV